MSHKGVAYGTEDLMRLYNTVMNVLREYSIAQYNDPLLADAGVLIAFDPARFGPSSIYFTPVNAAPLQQDYIMRVGFFTPANMSDVFVVGLHVYENNVWLVVAGGLEDALKALRPRTDVAARDAYGVLAALKEFYRGVPTYVSNSHEKAVKREVLDQLINYTYDKDRKTIERYMNGYIDIRRMPVPKKADEEPEVLELIRVAPLFSPDFAGAIIILFAKAVNYEETFAASLYIRRDFYTHIFGYGRLSDVKRAVEGVLENPSAYNSAELEAAARRVMVTLDALNDFYET